jgi:hypothetical protein
LVIPESGNAQGGATADPAAAAFLARKAGPASQGTLHFYRHEAWNEANNNATHDKEYKADTPAAGYQVEPLAIDSGTGNPSGPSAQPAAAFISKKT